MLLADFHCTGNGNELPIEAAARQLIFQKKHMRCGRETLALIRDVLSRHENIADHVLIAGDLTDTGSDKQFKAVASALSAYSGDFISVVPGNHDIARFYPFSDKDKQRGTFYSYFRKLMGGRAGCEKPGVCFPYVKTVSDKFAIIGLDSTILDRPIYSLEGSLGDEQLNNIKRILNTGEYADSHVVFLLHHNPADRKFRPFVGNVLADTGEFKKALFSSINNGTARGITVVSGHTHEATVERRNGVNFICVPGLAFYENNPSWMAIEISYDGNVSQIE